MTKAEHTKWLNELWNHELFRRNMLCWLLPLLDQLALRRKTPLPLTELTQALCKNYLYRAVRSGWSDEEIIGEIRKRLPI
jgi:hypothetical protein